MLDTLIHKINDGSIKTTVYKKKTHTDQYLAADSHHPLQHKLGVIRTLYHRAEVVNTLKEDENTEKEGIKQALCKCGYRDWHFKLVSRDKPQSRERRRNTNTSNKGSVTLPYIKGTSEALRRIFNKRGVTVHMKPRNTLRQLLVAPKDKLDKKEQSGVVYRIPCKDCDASYVGESERALGTRLDEHRRKSGVNSVVVGHTTQTNHDIDWPKVKILDREDRWYERGVREAAHIRLERPSLNRDAGRFQLPGIYNHLLRTKTPPPPDPVPTTPATGST